MTQQFRFCGNPLRVDVYKGCDFGCKYCYANTRKGNYSSKADIANFNKIKQPFINVFEKKRDYENIEAQMIRHRVPLHLGGMSDPFQKREEKYELAYKLLKLTKKYNYPIQISTKTASLPKKYWDILDPNIHAFQISLMGIDGEFVDKYETNTPSPNERLNFANELREKGFWVSLRLQPLVNIGQAKKLVAYVGDVFDFITVEHLKIPFDAPYVKELFDFEKNKDDYYNPKLGKNYELKTKIKRKNIQELKKLTNTPIGVGDNDLHQLSDSRNCCGLDTINNNFNNYMKYNSTYFLTSDEEVNKDNIWYPSASCSKCFNSTSRKKGLKTVKDYTDYYLNNIINKSMHEKGDSNE